MSRKVLIVDDAAFMRNMLKCILVKADYEIVGEAEDGRDAVDKYKELAPDLVTMDITMPEMNGIEAVEKINNFDHDARIIMCTAMGQKALIIEALKAGAKDFIVKPFNKERVLEAFDKVMLSSV
ncbi:MAG: response regulator [Halothermotrichaceae bacterium]